MELAESIANGFYAFSQSEIEQIDANDDWWAFLLRQGSGSGATIRIEESGVEETVNRLKEVVNAICSTFGLTKDEFAQVCQVSRKTLYNWINGSFVPPRDTINRIFNLFVVAQDWRESGFVQDKSLLRQPVLQGESLIDVLSKPGIDRERVLFIGSRLSLIERKARPLKDPFA